MAEGRPSPTISLRERSFPLVGGEEKLSRWLVFSLLLHGVLIVSMFIIPILPSHDAPAYPVYTVDLVGGEKIGATNLGTELRPPPAPKETPKAKATEPPAPVIETKKEPKKEAIEKAKPVEKKAPPTEEKIVLKEKTKKEPVKAEPAKESTKETRAETKAETKAETASLDTVRERLIQSAVERAKNRAEATAQPAKGEAISSGHGEGEGAAALGQGGRGGGVVKGMDFIIYQNRMLSTIKNNWAWPGQRSNLRVVVRFNIKDNGEIIGLRIVQRSGDPAYDDSVLRAVKKSSPLPALPESVRKDFSEVELAFRPEDLGA